jgi:DNA mismatch repair protein MutS
MGDFYELFYDDARRAAKLIDITLTSRPVRGRTIQWPACLITRSKPISRAWCWGESVAICEQIGDPAVERRSIAVVRVAARHCHR